MKINTSLRARPKGFTLIEMIGVLAIIAILASMLLPKVFAAINNSKINNTALSYNTAKTGTVESYAEKGTFVKADGSALTSADLPFPFFDKDVLVARGFLDKVFKVKVGDNVGTQLFVVAGSDTVEAPFSADNSAPATAGGFDLNGEYSPEDTTTSPTTPASGSETVGATYVVVAKITGVAVNDAIELSQRLDGDSLSEPDPTAADLLGRVKYEAPANAGDPVTVYVYVAHR